MFLLERCVMITINPYSTTATKGYNVGTVETAIRRFLPTGAFKLVEGSNSVYSLDAGSVDYAIDVPSWGHPLVVDDKVFIDLRNHTKYDMRTRLVAASNPSEIKLATIRAQLTLALLRGSNVHLQTFSNLPISVFTSWLSEQIARRFSLDYATQYRLSILSGMYYYSMLVDKDVKFDESYIQQAAMTLSRSLNAKSEDVFALYDNLDSGFSDITDFCNKVATKLENVRLESFSVPLLYTLIGGTWVGFNSREVAAVSLEHVPTFIAMLALATSDRGFNYASFTKLVQRKAKRELEDFSQRLNSIYLTH